MPIKVILDQRITDNTWSAVGSFSTSEGTTGPAEVLVKEVSPKKFQLVLNASIKVSKIMNREVTLYTSENPPVEVSSVKKGTLLTFEKISLKLKK